MNLYNNKHLEPPPSSSCKLPNQEINLHELNGLMNDALNLFSCQFLLDAESKLLHTLVRQNKLRFRTQIGYKKLQKLNRCIRTFHEFDYKSLISWFIDLLPTKYESDTYFPSRNMLDYFLVKTQGLSKLFVRLFDMCAEVYTHWLDKMRMGHYMGLSIIIIAVQARIFIIMRYLLKCICHIYDTLRALRDKVPNIKWNYLPDNYHLPNDLLPWLDIDWLYQEHVFELKGKNRDIVSINIFDDDDEVEFCKEYKIGEDDEDLQIVNEYFNIVDSDEEGNRCKIEEIDDELQIIHENVKNAFSMNKGKMVKVEMVQPQIINLEDEIGEPVNINSKYQEVCEKLKAIVSFDALEEFVKDGNHNYFRSRGMGKYRELLNMIELHKIKLKKADRGKNRRLLYELKNLIIAFVSNEYG